MTLAASDRNAVLAMLRLWRIRLHLRVTGRLSSACYRVAASVALLTVVRTGGIGAVGQGPTKARQASSSGVATERGTT